MVEVGDTTFIGFCSSIIYINADTDYLRIDYTSFDNCKANDNYPNIYFNSQQASETKFTYLCVTRCISLTSTIQQFSKIETGSSCNSIFDFITFYNSQSTVDEAYGHTQFVCSNIEMTNMNISHTIVSTDVFFKSYNSPKVSISYVNTNTNQVSNRNCFVIDGSSSCRISFSNFIKTEFSTTATLVSGLIYLRYTQARVDECCITENIMNGQTRFIIYLHTEGTVVLGNNYLQNGLYSTEIPDNNKDSQTILIRLYESYECKAMLPFLLNKNQCSSYQNDNFHFGYILLCSLWINPNQDIFLCFV